jgi:hypothetical protein
MPQRYTVREAAMADRIARAWLSELGPLSLEFKSGRIVSRPGFEEGISLDVLRLAGKRTIEIAELEGY